jgi:hypothetical protein
MCRDCRIRSLRLSVNLAGAYMIANRKRLLIVLGALAAGVIFVLTVRTASLEELARRSRCASAETGSQLHACHTGDSNGPSD